MAQSSPLKNAVAQILPFNKKAADREDLAFLPAALEIVETPASPVARLIAYTIMGFFALAVIWSCIGKVDIIASAKGRIIPSGRTKVIQPFETGVVRSIDVHDGQTVKAGDTVIKLDPTINDAETKHYQSDLAAAELDVARLQAELSDGDPLQNFEPPDGPPNDLIAVQRKFLFDQTAEQQDKLAVLERQRQQKQAEHATIEATVDKLEASLPVMQERLQIRQTLFEHNTGSKAEYLELLQAYVEEQHELDVQKRKAEEETAAIAAIDEQRKETVEAFRRERYGDLVEATRKANGLQEEVVRAQHRAALQVMVSPVDGTVQQLAVHTVGGVVTPAQTLMVIVPSDSHLEIEAMVENRDIGFVHGGQEAQIKVDAFNFNRYGLVGGKVTSVSPDAIARDKPVDKNDTDRADDGEVDSSEPSNQQLVYAARISLDQTRMQVEDRMVNLSPGMAVTVEIKTGERRIISYLLSPLLKFKQEALRER
jgi:membrane fusion protein, hemolysin D